MARDQRDNSHQAEAFTPTTLGAAADLRHGRLLAEAAGAGCATIEARLGVGSLWLVLRSGGGAMALRTAFSTHALTAERVAPTTGALMAFTAGGPEARFRVQADVLGERLLRVRTWITPTADLLPLFWPRDLYPLGPDDDPCTARGEVIAAQRGYNAPVMFLRIDPARTAALYFQNLTALEDWFAFSRNRPDGAVGGRWPELGYQPPGRPNAPSPPEFPLPAGREMLMSDAFIALCPTAPEGEQEEADFFLEGLAAIYPHLDKPRAEYRDWPDLAERTLRTLSRSPGVTVKRYGHVYPRPYVDAEVPDSMVQLAVLRPLTEYAVWRGRPAPLAKRMRAGVDRFFDADLGAIRRFLPNVAAGTEPIPKARDKDADQVDSWYLYHPLANLGRLAAAGDRDALTLFLGSLDYAIKVARHFKYEWPILFDTKTLKPSTEARKPGGPGQTDVGGLYAYVMLQAYEFTGKKRFLEEARRGVEATRDLGFELVYQTNITAWAVVACVKLWRITGDDFFRRQSHLFIAGFFHNTIFWESNLDAARHYQTFLGATCLHDGPYMALYECFESFDAFRQYMELADDGLPEPLRLLMTEYCRHTLSRAWGFYPAHLPPDILAGQIRNGRIDRALAIPVEDLYADGQPPGQVGQEIYGAGAPFVFCRRAFQRLDGAPAMIFCDYPVRDGVFAGDGWSGRIDGWDKGLCRLRIIAEPGVLHRVRVSIEGEPRPLEQPQAGHWELNAPGCGRVEVLWERRRA